MTPPLALAHQAVMLGTKASLVTPPLALAHQAVMLGTNTDEGTLFVQGIHEAHPLPAPSAHLGLARAHS